jgi:hypothetical protein
MASATLTDLLFTHKHKLLTALGDEGQLLTAAQIDAPQARGAAPIDNSDAALVALANRTLALARELATGKNGNGRSAEAIASDLTTAINELNVHAHAIQVIPQDSAKLDKKK